MTPPSQLRADFRATFNADPTFFVRAPGRADLMGSHTDYNEGWVLPMAIDRYVWLAARPTSDGQASIRAFDLDDQATFPLSNLAAKQNIAGAALPSWTLYAAGVAWSLQGAGFETPGCQMALMSDIPVGSGLSSSAAIEVAFALAWLEMGGKELDRMTMAYLCQKSENEYVGVSSGLLDPFACACGQAGYALLFDTRSLDWEAVSLPDELVFLVADTGVRRDLTSSAYNERFAECKEALVALSAHLPNLQALRDVPQEALEEYGQAIPDVARLRARHVINENARVLAAADALRQGDAQQLGVLMDGSHLSMRDLFEASGPALDEMWHLSHGLPGRLGGRILGAGWAGCMIFLVRSDGLEEFTSLLRQGYMTNTGNTPEFYAVQGAEGVKIV